MVTTFVPFPDIKISCEVLDTSRLGKQRSEIKIMLAAITGVRFKLIHGEDALVLPEKRGYQNHSATRMWRESPLALSQFGMVNCEVWAERLGHDLEEGVGWETYADMVSWYSWLSEQGASSDMPLWWGREDVHSSHRAVLLSKDYEYYQQFGWDEEPKYEYVWPV